jgi:hypothetical protein
MSTTKSFAQIIGPCGILVNCVAPDPVEDTAMFQGIPDARKHQIMASVISGRCAAPWASLLGVEQRLSRDLNHRAAHEHQPPRQRARRMQGGHPQAPRHTFSSRMAAEA